MSSLNEIHCKPATPRCTCSLPVLPAWCYRLTCGYR